MGFNKFSRSDGMRIVLILFIVGVVYCGLGTEIWTDINKLFFRLPIHPAALTSTPVPTNTPAVTPTSTPAPTKTPDPTPIPTSAYLPGEVISYWNEFDNSDPIRGDWVFFPNARVENGLLIIDHSKDWDGVYGNQHLDNGQTVMFQFRFDAWTDLHIAVETGEFQTESYRSWGVGAEAGLFSPVYSEGAVEFENSFTPDDLMLAPGEWYVLMLHIGDGDDPFVARIWELYNTDNAFEVRLKMNASWNGQQWLPLILAGPAGKLELERYEELQ